MNQMASAPIAFTYQPTGEVTCSNPKGLTFFLFAEPFCPKPSTDAAPSSPAPAWKQVAATQEVEVRRASEPLAIAELARAGAVAPCATFKAVEATHEVAVRRAGDDVPAVAHLPQPQPQASRSVTAPGASTNGQKGWFTKLFAKAH